MPKETHLTDAELDARDNARDYIRGLYGTDENRNDLIDISLTVDMVEGEAVVEDISDLFWTALKLVWPPLVLKGRQTVSIADKVFAFVSNSDGPVDDTAVYMNCDKVGIADARRYLAREVTAPCIAMEKVSGNDSDFTIACDDSEVQKYKEQGFKVIEIRKRRTAAEMAADAKAAKDAEAAEAAERAAEAAEAAKTTEAQDIAATTRESA